MHVPEKTSHNASKSISMSIRKENMNEANMKKVHTTAKVMLFTHVDTQKHRKSEAKHQECPERVMAILKMLEKSGLGKKLVMDSGHSATLSELSMVHHPNYVKRILATSENPSRINIFGTDMYANEHSADAARRAVGMSLDAATSVLFGFTQHAFVLCRPPGHHATYKRASGFCMFNNVVYAAKLLSQHLRVVIFDWDVHHGDGTTELIRGMDRVKLITVQKTHYENGVKFYPGTGKSKTKGNIVSIGFQGDIFGKKYMKIFNDRVVPVLEDYRPHVVLISAGFDAAEGDPLGGCHLMPEHYKSMTQTIKLHCKNVIAFLEGGYNLDTVAKCTCATVEGLLEE